MDVVINQIVAILQILSFGDAVRGNEHINLFVDIREKHLFLLRYRREEGQHGVEIEFLAQTQSASGLHIAGNKRRVETCLFVNAFRQIVVQILGRIGKCRKDKNLHVPVIDRVFEFVA